MHAQGCRNVHCWERRWGPNTGGEGICVRVISGAAKSVKSRRSEPLAAGPDARSCFIANSRKSWNGVCRDVTRNGNVRDRICPGNALTLSAPSNLSSDLSVSSDLSCHRICPGNALARRMPSGCRNIGSGRMPAASMFRSGQVTRLRSGRPDSCSIRTSVCRQESGGRERGVRAWRPQCGGDRTSEGTAATMWWGPNTGGDASVEAPRQRL